MSGTNKLKRYTSLAVAADLLTNKQLALVSPSLWVDENDKFLLDQYKSRAGHQFVGAVCMTTAKETFHHWKTFADGLNGVCIEFDRADLEGQISQFENLRAGMVSYVKVDDIKEASCNSLWDLPFQKRRGFSAEQEYRIVYGGAAVDGCYKLPIRINWIRKITLSPFVPDALAPSIKAMLRKIEGCDDVAIKQSRLTNSTSWKRGWTKKLGATFGVTS